MFAPNKGALSTLISFSVHLDSAVRSPEAVSARHKQPPLHGDCTDGFALGARAAGSRRGPHRGDRETETQTKREIDRESARERERKRAAGARRGSTEPTCPSDARARPAPELSLPPSLPLSLSLSPSLSLSLSPPVAPGSL